MYKILIVLFVLLCSSALSQAPFRSLSLSDAINLAKKENKLVMAVYNVSDCRQCDEVAQQGLSTISVKQALDKNFIFVKGDKMPEEVSSVVLFNQKGFLGVLYFDGERNLVHVQNGSTTMAKTYTDNMDSALRKAHSAEPTLGLLRKSYFGPGSDINITMQLIKKIKSFNLDPAPQILDDLVQKAPADSANSISFLQFVMRAAPLVNTEARKYLTKNTDIYNMAWYRMDLPERQRLNNIVIDRSLSRAIEIKDLSLMTATSSFAMTVNNPNYEAGQRAFMNVQLTYYREIKDSANFIRTAFQYYDRYLMNESIEQIRRTDSLYRERQLKTAPRVTTPTEFGFKQTMQIQAAPRAQYVSRELNNGAWALYKFSNAPQNIAKALSWAKRAAEVFETPESMDTYAHLLYLTGNKEEGMQWEKRAIESAKNFRRSPAFYENILSQMEQGKAVLTDPFDR